MASLKGVRGDEKRLLYQSVDPQSLLRLPQVLALIPVSASTWWNGVRTGRFPAPIKLGPRTTVWRACDVLALTNPRFQ
jgi:prophage regulatory protein